MLHPRARTMLLLSIPAIVIGIAASLVLIVAMKTAAMLQNILWSSLPGLLGMNASGPFWTIAILTGTGIAVGLVVRFSPGHAGPDPYHRVTHWRTGESRRSARPARCADRRPGGRR